MNPNRSTLLYFMLPGDGGRASVTATVGRGEFATAIQLPAKP